MSQPNECKSKTNRDLVTGISRDFGSQRKFTGSRWIPKDIQYFLYPIGIGFSFTTIKGNPSCKPRRRVPLVKLEAVLLKNLIKPGNRSSKHILFFTHLSSTAALALSKWRRNCVTAVSSSNEVPQPRTLDKSFPVPSGKTPSWHCERENASMKGYPLLS